jgi:hypothetical protein
MNVKKEVYDKCCSVIDRELNEVKYKLLRNKIEIKRLSEQQRILKAEMGKTI